MQTTDCSNDTHIRLRNEFGPHELGVQTISIAGHRYVDNAVSGTVVLTFDRAHPGVEKSLADSVFGPSMAEHYGRGPVATAHYLFNHRASALTEFVDGLLDAGKIDLAEAGEVTAQVGRLAHPVAAAA